MGPSPTVFVSSVVHYGSEDADFFEVILDEDDTPTYILYLGAGDDHVIFDNTGIAPGNGRDLLSGGEGCDTLEGAVAVLGSFVADGGSGDDYFDFDFSFFAHGSAAVKGGSGHDYIDVVILVPPPVTFDEPAAAGSLAIDGGDGDDEVHLAIKLENSLVTSYAFHGTGDVDLGAGDDCLFFDIVGTEPTETGPVKLGPLQISAGDGNDQVAVGISGEYINSIQMLNGVIETGAGDDGIVLDDVILLNSRVDAGSGNDSVVWTFLLAGENEVPPANGEVHGGSGNDTFDIEITLSGSVEFDILVGGGDGNDVVHLGFGFESIATEADRKPGKLLVDGGAGDDTLYVFAEASDEVGPEDAFHVRGDAGSDRFVVTKGQETVVIDDFTLGEDQLFLNGIFSEDEFDATRISKVGPASTGIFDAEANLVAVLQNIAPEDLCLGDITFGEYVPAS